MGAETVGTLILWLIGLAIVVVIAVYLLRWLYRRIRNDELTREFVEDMATNHLPHIYDLLLKLCARQGIENEAPPPIRWIDLDRNRRQ